jgi:hypothetical protein
VLHLSRGGYDPKEHRYLRGLVDAYPDFRVAYTRIVVISTDNQLDTNEFRDSPGAEWPFLADPERVVQRDRYWYWGRPSVGELRLDLRTLLQRIRPDFDLSAPGVREAWESGEREMFLVQPPEGEAIRYTEGTAVGVKR